VADLGLSPDEFWDLSFFEWSLYVLRYKRQQEQKKERYEHDWSIARVMWATLCNLHRDPKKHPAAYEPKDLIKLSFDDYIEKEAHNNGPTDDLMDRLKKKYGAKLNGDK
jgi:hypothetical protein